MVTTVNDIARAAGVSRRTVIRALKNDNHVSAVTKSKILEIAAEMHYHPNAIARSLISGKSDLIGFYGHTGIMDLFHRYIEMLESPLVDRGYSILYYTSTADPAHESACLRSFIEKRVAGALVAPGPFDSRVDTYYDLVQMGIKLVIMDKSVEDLDVPQFTTNPYLSAFLPTEYLVSLGHRRIVYLAIPETSHIGRERARGFWEAIAEAGISSSQCSVIPTPLDEHEAAKTMASIISCKDRPTAVITRHDYVAVGAMRAILAAGLSIPSDISIVGYGDKWPCDMLRAPLTTVRHPVSLIAENAIECLLDMIDGKNVETGTRLLDVELVIRESCAPPKIA